MSNHARNMLVPKRLVLHNLGPFRDFELRFEPGTDPTRADIHLFVGINGTGKTTLLHAMGVALGLEPWSLLAGAATDPDAYVLLETEEAVIVRTAPVGGPPSDVVRALFEGDPRLNLWTIGDKGLLAAQLKTAPEPVMLERYVPQAPAPAKQRLPVDSAAFLYSAQRTPSADAASGMQRVTGNPLVEQTPLLQWVLNQHVKAMLARSAGAEQEAEANEQSARLIVEAFSLLFEQKLDFDIDRQRLEAHLTLDGKRIQVSSLAQGMQSLLAWFADLITRLDRAEWTSHGAVTERPFVVLVDELEVHLHPALQRKVLDVFQTLFPNATLFGSTHSPHVVISPSDARIYPLRLGPNGPTCEPLEAQDGLSASAALQDIFCVDEFNPEVQAWLQELMALGDDQLRGEDSQLARFEELASKLSQLGTETANLVGLQRRQLARRLGRS